MTDIASKNLYELLGNDPDQDSDREPDPPTKVIDKTPARHTKRNAPAEAPASKAPAGGESRGPRRGGFQGNEGAFRDRNAGSAQNRGKPVDENVRDDRHSRRGGGRGRGAQNFDRHSRGVGG
ncbi:Stm1-domain-containing protein [Bisporella sp. PMI_857]|nr:Stm1-domain-containing protein [Bisporella sp. PMI_857]